MTDAIVVIALLLGTFLNVVAAIGLARMPDVYSRLHAVTKATTFGMIGLLTASAVHFGMRGENVLPEVITLLFVCLTNPAGGHMIARSAYLAGIPMSDPKVDELDRAGEIKNPDHDIH